MAQTTWCSFLGDSSFARAVSVLGLRTADRAGLLGAPGSGGLAMDPRALARWLEVDRSQPATEPAPDLGDRLDEAGLAGPAREDLCRFEDLLRPRAAGCFVGRCVADDGGSYAVAVYRKDRPGPQVRVGDSFFSGVQLSGSIGSGVVLVEPHVLRCICVNGAAVPVAAGGAAYARWSAYDAEGDLDAVVELGFSGALARDVEADLRRATATPQPRLSDLRARGLLRIEDERAASLAEAVSAEEPTLYGLYNAMTRVARDTHDVRTAVGLERTAGRLLTALIRNPLRDPVAQDALAPV